MLEEAAGPGRRLHTAPLELPYGRGINFQLAVDDVDAIHSRALASKTPIIIPMEERWYPLGTASGSTGGAAAAGPRECGGTASSSSPIPTVTSWRPYRDLGVRPAA